MKIILNIVCWLLAVYCIYFPLSYYNGNMNKKEIKLSHILLNSKEDADKVKKEITEGKRFSIAVKEYSQCEDTKDKNGDLGYFVRGVLVPELDKVVFNELKVNKVSNPVKSDYGWHIFKITEIKHFSDKENFGVKYI